MQTIEGHPSGVDSAFDFLHSLSICGERSAVEPGVAIDLQRDGPGPPCVVSNHEDYRQRIGGWPIPTRRITVSVTMSMFFGCLRVFIAFWLGHLKLSDLRAINQVMQPTFNECTWMKI